MSNTSAISQLTPGTPTLASLIEGTNNPGSSPQSVSFTLAQIQALLGGTSIAGKCRTIPGYGLQLYDPATPTHPWRSKIIANGVEALEIGIPDTAPVIPTLATAPHSGGNNNLTFTWTDINYGGSGNLEVWKNGALLATIANNATTYVDTGGAVGAVYQMRWNSGVYGSTLSNSITAA